MNIEIDHKIARKIVAVELALTEFGYALKKYEKVEEFQDFHKRTHKYRTFREASQKLEIASHDLHLAKMALADAVMAQIEGKPRADLFPREPVNLEWLRANQKSR